MSTLTFDIAQLFSSLNHILLSLILDKAGFDSKISSFFSNYLINRKTQYVWNNFISLFLEQLLIWTKVLPYLLFCLYFILLLSFIFLRKELRFFHLPFLFCLFCLLISVFLFLRKKAMKNPTQIYFVVIVLSLLFLNSLASQFNITNQRFFIFLGLQKIMILLS